MEAKFEVKKAAIEISIKLQKQNEPTRKTAPDRRKPFFLQVVKEKCDMCNRKTKDRFRNY